MFGVALRLPLNNTDYIIGWYYLERDGESIDSPGGRYFPDENIYSQAAASLATRLATVSGAKTSKTQASLKLFNTLYAFFPNPKPYPFNVNLDTSYIISVLYPHFCGGVFRISLARHL